MENISLEAELRSVEASPKVLRRTGKVPGVVYGQNYEPTPIQFDGRTLSRLIKKAGTHSLVSLQIEGRKPQMTIVRDIQRDVIKHHLLHIDLYAVQMDVKITSKVPVVFVGESPIVVSAGAVLTQNMDSIEVECLPGDLPDSLEVDLSVLKEFGDGITIADLTLGEGVVVLTDPESLIIKVEAPRIAEEAVVESDGALAGAEPEVITAAKEE